MLLSCRVGSRLGKRPTALCDSQLWQIVVFGIGTRQGCKLFMVVPPHLILVARICICIIIGSLDRVIEALRSIIWLVIEVIQEDIIKMAPSRVHSNKKEQNLQLIEWKKIHFGLIEWEQLFQLQVKLQFIRLRRQLKNYIMNV
jgi:hypothetical protein